jgi:hypothetical protein
MENYFSEPYYNPHMYNYHQDYRTIDISNKENKKTNQNRSLSPKRFNFEESNKKNMQNIYNEICSLNVYQKDDIYRGDNKDHIQNCSSYHNERLDSLPNLEKDKKSIFDFEYLNDNKLKNFNEFESRRKIKKII